MDSLPDRPLKQWEFRDIKDQNPRFHKVIGGGPGSDISGFILDSDDGESTHLVLWSPRFEEWVHHDTFPRDIDVDEQGEIIDEFVTHHYPDDHVLNKDGKGFGE